MELSEIIASVDIVEYISQYVDLTQRGDEWWGLSCFKEENTPSFSVRRDPPFFYDYSSGIGGNLFTFIKEYHKCDNKKAVEIIKNYAKIEENSDKKCEKMHATLDCKRFLRKNQTKIAHKTTVLSNDYMERYEKRNDKLSVWESEGISRETLDKYQVYYDSFSNRLVYPIRNLEGEIVNIGGRTLDPDFKEKKIRKYTYFYPWGGAMALVYGLYENLEYIKQKKEVIIFEGCKSVLIAHTWGLKNCGALLTSHCNPHQMKILAQLGCRVVFALDKEIDVTKDKNIQKLKNYVNVEYVYDKDNLLGEKDSPVDKGKEVFKSAYRNRKHFRS